MFADARARRRCPNALKRPAAEATMAALLHGFVVSPALAAVQISGWKSSQRPPSAVAAARCARGPPLAWGPSASRCRQSRIIRRSALFMEKRIRRKRGRQLGTTWAAPTGSCRPATERRTLRRPSRVVRWRCRFTSRGLPRGLGHDLSPSRRCGARRRGVFRRKISLLMRLPCTRINDA